MPKCGDPKCGVSTGEHGRLTFGKGKLDDHGYWKIPCGICARNHEENHPEYGPCWPFKRKEFEVEIASDDSNVHKVIKVEAHTPEHALKIIEKRNEVSPDEFVYQIATDLGSELPQPCYDFINGFLPYKELYPFLWEWGNKI